MSKLTETKETEQRIIDEKKKELRNKVIANVVMTVIAASVFWFMARSIAEKPKETKVDINPKINTSDLSKAVENKTSELDKLKTLQFIDIYEKGLVTSKSLIDACKLGNTNQDSCNTEIAKITKKLITTGNLSKAKLYIKAGVSRDNGPIAALTQYDSIWFFLDTLDISGHLIRSKALYSGVSEDGLTELVFDFSNLPISKKDSYSESNPYEPKDGLKQLNSKTEHLINSFIATEGFGKIETMQIYYEGNGSVQLAN